MGQNHSLISYTVLNDGTGLSLPKSRGRVDLPIGHPPDEGTREIDDGTSSLHPPSQPQQSNLIHAQPHAQYHYAPEERGTPASNWPTVER